MNKQKLRGGICCALLLSVFLLLGCIHGYAQINTSIDTKEVALEEIIQLAKANNLALKMAKKDSAIAR